MKEQKSTLVKMEMGFGLDCTPMDPAESDGSGEDDQVLQTQCELGGNDCHKGKPYESG